jgi:hypothetical protein
MITRDIVRAASACLLAARLIFGALSQSDAADSAPKQLPKDDKLYRVVVAGKCGYINRQGRMVIQPQFLSYGEFHDGLAQASDGKRIFYIDKTGKEVFASPFTRDHKPYCDGFAQGSIGLKFHYLDTKGKLLPGFHAATTPFSEGMAAVGVNPARFDPALREKGGEWSPTKWGFIDSTGTMVIPANYWSVGSFSHGLAPVLVGGSAGDMCTGPAGGSWGFINKRGELVIKPAYQHASPFSEGLAKVVVKDQGTGYIDTTGKMVIPPRLFSVAMSFHDGVARIRGSQELGDPGWQDSGYIDKDGKITLFPKGITVEEFSEGIAPANDKPTWNGRASVQGLKGYVDKRGEWVIKPQFDHAGMFQDGIAEVTLDGARGWIEKSGKYLWPLTK